MNIKEMFEKKHVIILSSALYIFVMAYAVSAIMGIVSDMGVSTYSLIFSFPMALVYGIHIPWAKKKKQPIEKIWGEMGLVIGSLVIIILDLCIILFNWYSFETWIGRGCVIIAMIYEILKFSGWIGGGVHFKMH